LSNVVIADWMSNQNRDLPSGEREWSPHYLVERRVENAYPPRTLPTPTPPGRRLQRIVA
jgi:hypothetical protein